MTIGLDTDSLAEAVQDGFAAVFKIIEIEEALFCTDRLPHCVWAQHGGRSCPVCGVRDHHYVSSFC